MLERILTSLPSLAISVGELLLLVLLMVGISRFLDHRYADQPTNQFRKQWILFASSVLSVILFIIILPIGDTLRGQLLSLFGILVSAAIALSATTFISNVMAGLMLRTIQACRPGDFIRVGEHFGRVTEMDLLHTEIQTEDRDLTTLPNLHLVTTPVKVMRSSGTIISVSVSLGYDVPRQTVEELLTGAAEATGLEGPFVQIMELGDFSIVYKVAGLLKDVTELIKTRAALRANTVDALHGGGVEIVSPNFMNTRQLDPGATTIPSFAGTPLQHRSRPESQPDAMVFDKATEAESVENLRAQHELAQKEIKDLEAAIGAIADEAERTTLADKLALLQERSNQLSALVKEKSADLSEKE